jgi:hypothetical protein
VGPPDVVATSGVRQAIRPPLIGVNRPHRAGEGNKRQSSARVATDVDDAPVDSCDGDAGDGNVHPPGVGAALQRWTLRTTTSPNRGVNARGVTHAERSPTRQSGTHVGQNGATRLHANVVSNARLSVLVGRSDCRVWRSGYVLEVSDASSLRGGRSNRASHQSRPRRLTPPRTDASRICPSPQAGRPRPGRPGTPRPSRQPTPTQVSGPTATQLRAWSRETAAKRRYSPRVDDVASDDQRRSYRIRPQVRRRSIIPCKAEPFGCIDGGSKSGVTATYGGLRAVRAFGVSSRSSTSGSDGSGINMGPIFSSRCNRFPALADRERGCDAHFLAAGADRLLSGRG